MSPSTSNPSLPLPPRSHGTHRRLHYLDALRGIAVLVMIEAHTLDAWTRMADRKSRAYLDLMVVGGAAAPGFLFLAGVGLALLAEARRPSRGRRLAAGEVARRGLEIFGLAFLFRLQAYLLEPSARPGDLLKVDILNVMGPAIVVAAALWGVAGSRAMRCGLLALAAVAAGFLTPAIRLTTSIAALPDPLEWYLWPRFRESAFTLFPWSGFVLAGFAVGVLIDQARARGRDNALQAALAAGGALLAAGSYLASWMPSPYPRSSFWTTSPSFFFIRLGLLVVAIPLAYTWAGRQSSHGPGFRLVERLGRASLFVYWVHVELVYGFLSWLIGRRLPLPWALVAFVVFSALMIVLVRLKARLGWRPRVPQPGLQHA